MNICPGGSRAFFFFAISIDGLVRVSYSWFIDNREVMEMSKKTQYSVSNYHNEHVMRWHWQKLKERHLASQGK